MPIPTELNSPKQKSELRRKLRSERAALSPKQQRVASENVARRFIHSGFMFRSKHIALYFSSDGEVDLSVLLGTLYRSGYTPYFPLITDFKRKKMVFVQTSEQTEYATNGYGILEPINGYKVVKNICLGTVLMPLVGFDSQLNRLGMGGGFYDRYFDEKTWPYKSKKPLMIGIAHENQKAKSIPTLEHDLKMDAVITDKKVYRK